VTPFHGIFKHPSNGDRLTATERLGHPLDHLKDSRGHTDADHPVVSGAGATWSSAAAFFGHVLAAAESAAIVRAVAPAMEEFLLTHTFILRSSGFRFCRHGPRHRRPRSLLPACAPRSEPLGGAANPRILAGGVGPKEKPQPL
jgi:hypothetical protein